MFLIVAGGISVKPAGKSCKVRARPDKSAAGVGISADRVLLRSIALVAMTLRKIHRPMQH
ncbi:hypothetical protein QT996_22075 [Microcoleus sp. S13C4]|uniref:hypothetical protein n=1 Tax=Microcoleus sp. S13_B4 TaxID=3055408 RepID=UPI002FD3D4DD